MLAWITLEEGLAMSIKTARRLIAAANALALLPLGGGVSQAITGVAEPFDDYYRQHDGIRLLGYALSTLVTIQGYPAQYFEKGRIEDHRADIHDPQWAFLYGLLTAELMQRDPHGSVSATSVTYADLQSAADPQLRQSPPSGFTDGTVAVSGGQFVPFDSQLRTAPGYVVTPEFWQYINRTDLFPGGWLHDVGLPMTGVLSTQVTKAGQLRQITMQAFERTVLSYDPLNPQQWQVERGNIGSDALRTLQASGDVIEIPTLVTV